MKHPLWILNSALALLLAIVLLFIFFSRQSVPAREHIEPELSGERIKQDEIKINISKIYENDIFDTYQKEFPKVERSQRIDIPLPQPPTPETPKIPGTPKPEFLDPLNITLKGIVVMADDETRNRAIIQDNQTKSEQSYKIGNMIGDAQLIRIFSNKVVFLRLNGQQEVLYLREKDATTDPAYTEVLGWQKVIQKVDNNQFNINPKGFIERVQNLAQLIDMLDLSTAFKKGASIGCRIGSAKPNSLGAALGLVTGDIITEIDTISTIDTPHRFAIYKEILAKNTGDTITIKLLRNGAEETIVYTLEQFEAPTILERNSPAQKQLNEEELKEKQIKALQEKNLLAPNIKEIKKRERQNMLSKGGLAAKPSPMTE